MNPDEEFENFKKLVIPDIRTQDNHTSKRLMPNSINQILINTVNSPSPLIKAVSGAKWYTNPVDDFDKYKYQNLTPISVVRHADAPFVKRHPENGEQQFINGLLHIFDYLTMSWYAYADQQPPKEQPMLEKIIRLYNAYMLQDVRSPMPHLAGPPGVGKSSVVEQLAELLGVNLHIVNVARINPIELEGVQMPVGNPSVADEYRLHLLTSTLWTQLKEGDIVLLDEFLRGFPEVYNGLLDIMTSRKVAGFELPKVFFIGASNSIAAYDKALEDRLLHIFVPDIRRSMSARMETKQRIVSDLGLHPQMVDSQEMTQLLEDEVLPMYEVLEQFKGKATVGSTTIKGQSVRKLVGQAKLREIQSPALLDLIEYNNKVALQDQKPQFVLLVSGVGVNPAYVKAAAKLGQPATRARLTQTQAENLDLNLQLIEMEEAKKETLTMEGDDLDDDDIF